MKKYFEKAIWTIPAILFLSNYAQAGICEDIASAPPELLEQAYADGSLAPEDISACASGVDPDSARAAAQDPTSYARTTTDPIRGPGTCNVVVTANCPAGTIVQPGGRVPCPADWMPGPTTQGDCVINFTYVPEFTLTGGRAR
jgi:hypothetical protein